jgi:CDP-diacylglycerol---glycerol-3-phosphate 3-phosphatidyltransferase
MLNKLRPALTRVLEPAGHALARTPLTPNEITVIGTVGVTAAALALFPTGHLFWGAIIATVFVLADMLDGALARVKGTSGKFGAFLDSTLDRVADAAIFGGMACYFVLHPSHPAWHNKVLAGVSLFCVVAGALVSYAKARAQGLGLPCDVGIAERPERMVIGLTAIGLSGLGVPYVLPVGLWLLAALSAFTFGQRVLAVRQAAATEAAKPGPAAGAAGAGTPAGPGTGAGSGAEAGTAQTGTAQTGTGAAGTQPAGTPQPGTDAAGGSA